jgi:hypothetical protein
MSTHNKLYVSQELFVPRVNGTDFTPVKWAHLGTTDQDLSETSDVSFGAVGFGEEAQRYKILSTSNRLTFQHYDGEPLLALNQFKQLKFGTDAGGFLMPTTRGLIGQSLQAINGDGDLDWIDPTHIYGGPFDRRMTFGTGAGIKNGSVNFNSQDYFPSRMEFRDEAANEPLFGVELGTSKIHIGDSSTTGYALPGTRGALGQVLVSDAAGGLDWTNLNPFDQPLNETNNVIFNDLLLNGDLTVQGSTTFLETVNTEIKDNIILFNSGETAAGVGGGSGFSGFEINRGTLDNKQLLYSETLNKWTVGITGGALGTTVNSLLETTDTVNETGTIPIFTSTGKLSGTNGLNSTQVTSLSNLDQSIGTSQWNYIPNFNQELSNTSDVVFNDITANGSLTLTSPIVEDINPSVLTFASSPVSLSNSYTLFDTTGGDISIVLPTAASVKGLSFVVYLDVAGGNTLIISPDTTELIGGSNTSFILSVVGQHVKLTSLGNGKWIVN